MKQNYPNSSMMDFSKVEEYQDYLDSLGDDEEIDFSNMQFNVTGLPKKTPFKDAMGVARNVFSEVGAFGVGIASEISDIAEILKDYEQKARTQYATADTRYGTNYLQKPDYRGAFLDGQFSEAQTPFFAKKGNAEKSMQRMPMSRMEMNQLKSFFETAEENEMGGMVIDADSDLIAKLIAAGADIEML
jgi:hypothetical protein